MKKLILISIALLSFLSLSLACTAEPITKKPVLLIGASLAKGHAQFKDGLNNVIPFATGSGSYANLEQALVHENHLVTNMAIGGSTVFGYTTGIFGYTDLVEGYQTQINRALMMTTLYDEFGAPAGINADFAVIPFGNEHQHGLVHPGQVGQSTVAQLNAGIDIHVAIGNQLVASGITPIFITYPAWGEMDFSAFEIAFGTWTIDQTTYELLADLYETRIAAEVVDENGTPSAKLVGCYDGYANIGDGLHPDIQSQLTCVDRIELSVPGF